MSNLLDSLLYNDLLWTIKESAFPLNFDEDKEKLLMSTADLITFANSWTLFWAPE